MPEVLDRSVIDEIIQVGDEDALEAARRRRSARACWPGSPPAPEIHAALQVAARPEMAGKRVVTIVRDGRRALHVLAILRRPCRLDDTDCRQVVHEIRCDITSARDRDPAARGVGTFEILTSWAGVQALLAHRRGACAL